MTPYLSGFLAHSIIAIAFLSLLLGILYSVQSISENEYWERAYGFVKTNFLIFLGFAILGLSVGLLSGSSLSPVIGQVIPSVLTFLGLIVVYQFASDKMPSVNKNIIAVSILLNCIFILYGNEISSIHRMKVENKKALEEHNRKKDLESHKTNLLLELEKNKKEIQIDLKKIEYHLDSLRNTWDK
jgi:hypothetical protein